MRHLVAALTSLFVAGGLLAPAASAQPPVTTLHTFGLNPPPSFPQAALIQAADGNFYGTTSWGGTSNAGTVFRMTAAGAVTVIHHFAGAEGSHPYAALMQARDGSFYGATLNGGSNNAGAVFRMTPDGSVAVLCGRGSNQSLTQAADGEIYGIYSGSATYGDGGAVFRAMPQGCVDVHLFSSSMAAAEGYAPLGPLLAAGDGYLYGTTSSGNGAIFRIRTSPWSFEVVHGFTGTDGTRPGGPLVQTPDGSIVGVTFAGGMWDSGTAFKLDSALNLSVLHSFSLPDDGLQSPGMLVLGSDGALYGAGWNFFSPGGGAFFRLTTTGDFQIVRAMPFSQRSFWGPLMAASDGNLYGTSAYGGVPSMGGMFRVHIADGTTDPVYDFPGDPGGVTPAGRLLETGDGGLWGTTRAGGFAGLGTVYVASRTGQFKTLHAFSGTDGADPAGGLIRASDGNFYGMARAGGTFGLGVVFRMDSFGAVTLLGSFAGGSDGANPIGALVQGNDGALYGVTSLGGAFNGGTAFRITLNGALSTLHAFGSPGDANHPASGLLQATDGNFYGVTSDGPQIECGTAYRMTPAGTVTIVHELNRSDGDYSLLGVNGLVQARDGNLYGTTQGIKSSHGTFFRIALDGTVTVVRQFSVNSESPEGALAEGRDGNFYGLFGGSVARLTPAGQLTALAPSYLNGYFNGFDSFIQAGDGNLYGTAANLLFRVNPMPVAPAALIVAPAPDGGVRLTWSPVAVATSYRISRGTMPGNATLLASGVTTTTFTDMTAVRGRHYYYVITTVNALGESTASYEVSITVGKAIAADFDGDGRADLGIFRPATGTWFIARSSSEMAAATSTQWGSASDVPLPGDFDGDGKADLTVFRPATGTWFVIPSRSGVPFAIQWGDSFDVPVPADYDGDGRTDVATFRPSTGAWNVLFSSSGFRSSAAYAWGSAGDRAAPGDYDGDGIADLAVYRPSNGTWYILLSGTGFTMATGYAWGNATDIAVPGDYDGDGKTDIAVFRPANGVWYILQSSTRFTAAVGYQWGAAGDRPVNGDFDGDGRDDVAVFRPSNGTWYILKSSTGFTGAAGYQWGNATDIPNFRQ